MHIKKITSSTSSQRIFQSLALLWKTKNEQIAETTQKNPPILDNLESPTTVPVVGSADELQSYVQAVDAFTFMIDNYIEIWLIEQ